MQRLGSAYRARKTRFTSLLASVVSATALLGVGFALAGVGESPTRAVDSDGKTCFGQDPTIVGTDADDGQLKGTDGADVIIAAKGADDVDAGAGNDLICLRGEGDRTDAGAGNDKVRGGGGADTIIGGPGKDELRGGKDDDELSGGPGRDDLDGRAGNDGCDGGPGKDHLKSCEHGTTVGANDPPVAAADSGSADEDHPTTVAVLANDSDPDGGSVAIGTLDTSATHGTASANADGTVAYDPHGQFESLAAGETAHDSFAYSATDGSAESDPATVDITVSGVDDTPIAIADSKTLSEDDAATAIDVLANDSDVDGGSKTITAKSNGSHGAVVITGSGSGLTYKPDANFCGIDSFTYTLNGGSSTTVSVAVTCVDDSGTAANDSATINEDSGANAIDVLANDTDIDGGSVSSVTQGAHGSVAVIGGGTGVSYTPNANFCSAPTDTFTYTVPGGSTATVTVTVNCVNDAPVNTVPGAQTTAEDTNLVLTGGQAISVSDSDAAPGNLQVTLTASHGTLTAGAAFAGNGTSTLTATATQAALNTALSSVTYAPASNYNGPASIAVDTSDLGNNGSGGTKTDSDSIAITVNAVDDAGTAVNDSPSVNEDSGSNTIDVLANDTDPDGGKAVASVDTTGTQGTVAITGDSSAVTYTPGPNFCGSDSFKYTLNGSGNGAPSATATVTVTVTCVNDGPVNFVPGAQSTNEDTNLVLSGGQAISVADSDAAPGNLQVTLTATHGLVTLSGTVGLAFSVGDGTADPTMSFTGTQANLNNALNGLTFAPAPADYNGPASIAVDTSDLGNNGSGGTKTDSDSIAITVNPVNDAPAVDLNGAGGGNDSTATFNEVAAHDSTGAVAIAPAATVADVDNADLASATVTLTNHPDGANESLAANTSGTSITADAYVSGSGVLFLHGTDTVAHYQQVIQSVTYNNTASPPNAASRSITVTANDTSLDSPARMSVVTVVPIDAAPVVDLDSTNAGSSDSSANFVEDGGAVNIAPNTTVTDADVGDNIESATVTLGARPDGDTVESLSANPGATGITVNYTQATGVLALSGSKTPAQYESVLQTVKYDNSSNTPTTTDRLVTVKANDGQADSVVRTATVHVAANNDPPVNSVPGAQTINEDNSKFLTGADKLSVSDPDAGSSPLRIDLSVNHGTINLSGTSGLIFTTGDGDGDAAMTFTGTATDINAALDNMQYTPTANYNGSETLSITTNDQGATGAGGAKTDTDSVAFTINSVNDAPELTQPDGTLTYTEDTPSENHADAIAPNLTLTDVDDTNIASATVEITSNFQSGQDVLSYANGGGVNGVVSGGGSKVTLTPSGASATVAQFRDALRAVKYSNTSDTPNTSTRTVSFQADDGHAANHASNTVTRDIGVVATNDAPVADDETFNGAQAAIPNTPLAVGTTQAEPSKTLNCSTPANCTVLTGDTDPDSPANVLTVGPIGTKAITTADGGKVTLKAGGNFTYFPKAQTDCTDPPPTDDSFTYTLSDNDATDPKTDTATVNLALTSDCIWYVDSSVGGPGTGTGDDPFKTVNGAAELNGVGGTGDKDGSGDTIMILDAATYSAASGTGIELEANQSLRSKRAGLTVGTDTIVTPSGASNPTISTSGGVALKLGSGNAIQGIDLGSTINAGTSLTGSSFGTATVNTVTSGSINNPNGKAIDVTTGTLNATFASVSAGAGAQGISLSSVDGTFQGNGGTLAGSTTAAVDINLGAGDFSYSGAISDPTGKAADITNRTGGTITLSGSITDTGSDTGGRITMSGNTAGSTTFSGATKKIDTLTANAIDLPSSNSGHTVNFTNGGLDVDTSSGTGLTSSGGVALNINGGSNTIDASAGKAIDIDGGASNTTSPLNTSFSSVSSAGSSTDAIHLDDVSGTFTSSGGSLQNATGEDVELNSGDANVTIDNTIADTSGTAVLVSGESGGTKDFNGAIGTSGSPAGAISLSNNTGATMRFDGDVILSTGATNAFSATGGGTVHVPDADVDNTLTTTTGTALNVANTTIGASGLNFKSISSDGAPNGIVLNSTGSSGGLTVTGDSSGFCGGQVTGSPRSITTAPNTADCTGGEIQNSSGADGAGTGIGVSLTSTSNVSLTRMHIDDHSNFAIRGSSVTGLTLSNVLVDGTNGSTTSPDEGSINVTNLLGSSSMTNSTVRGGFEDNINVFNNVGTAGTLTISDSTVRDNSTANGNDGVFAQADPSATFTLKVLNSVLQRNRGDHVNTTQSGTGVINTVVTGNTMTFNGTIGEPFDPATTAGGTVTLTTGAGFTNTSTFNVSNNNITGAKTAPININNASLTSTSGGIFSGTISNNFLGKAGALNSGSGDGDGLDVTANGDAHIRINITNNEIRQWKLLGINMVPRDGAATIDATVTGNKVGEPTTTTESGQAILFNAGPATTETGNSCADIGGAGALANSFPGSFTPGILPLRVRQRAVNTVTLPGYGGGNTDTAAVISFLSGRNNAVGTTATVNSPPGGGFVGGGPCLAGASPN